MADTAWSSDRQQGWQPSLAALPAAEHRVCLVFTGKPESYGGVDHPDPQAALIALCERLMLPADRLRVPQQVHEAVIQSCRAKDLSGTDAVLVDATHTPVLLLFADCVPIILYAPKQHCGAVIHAGWRGTALSIAAKTVAQLAQHCGANPAEMHAFIGPAIGSCCFETSPVIARTLLDTVLPVETLNMVAGLGPHHNPRVDLKGINRLQLQAVGVRHIEVAPWCTCCEAHRFWSHRRGETGRQAALLCLL